MLVEACNLDQGWSRPDDPARARRGQPGPGALLELVEHPVDVLVARLVLWRPGDHVRRVLVVERQRVGHRGHVVRIAAQRRHVVPDLALAVPLARQVSRPRPEPSLSPAR